MVAPCFRFYNEIMVGQLCSVIGCANGYYRLNKWKDSVCEQHAPEKRLNCACLLPYALHLFPRNEAIRRQWIVAVNRKDFQPQKNSVVCSHHFVDGKPTHKNPVPSVNLGNEEKDKPGHRKHRRRPQIPAKRRKSQACKEEQADCLPVTEDETGTVKEGNPYALKKLMKDAVPRKFVWTADPTNSAVSRSTRSKTRSLLKMNRNASHPGNENIVVNEYDSEDGQIVLNPADTVEIVVEVSGLLSEYAVDDES